MSLLLAGGSPPPATPSYVAPVFPDSVRRVAAAVALTAVFAPVFTPVSTPLPSVEAPAQVQSPKRPQPTDNTVEPIRDRTLPFSDALFPERVTRVWFRAVDQQAVAAAPRDRTSPFFDAIAPEKLPRRELPPSERQALARTPIDRASPFFDAVVPASVPRAARPSPGVEVAPIVVQATPAAPSFFDAVAPDAQPRRSSLRVEEQQALAFAARDRTGPFFDGVAPERVVRTGLPVNEQQFTTAPPRDRTSPYAEGIAPERVVRSGLPVNEQQFIAFAPRDRTAPYAEGIAPERVVRVWLPLANQQAVAFAPRDRTGPLTGAETPQVLDVTAPLNGFVTGLLLHVPTLDLWLSKLPVQAPPAPLPDGSSEVEPLLPLVYWPVRSEAPDYVRAPIPDPDSPLVPHEEPAPPPPPPPPPAPVPQYINSGGGGRGGGVAHVTYPATRPRSKTNLKNAVRKAMRKLAGWMHPDAQQNLPPEAKKIFEARMRDVTEAYEALKSWEQVTVASAPKLAQPVSDSEWEDFLRRAQDSSLGLDQMVFVEEPDADGDVATPAHTPLAIDFAALGDLWTVDLTMDEVVARLKAAGLVVPTSETVGTAPPAPPSAPLSGPAAEDSAPWKHLALGLGLLFLALYLVDGKDSEAAADGPRSRRYTARLPPPTAKPRKGLPKSTPVRSGRR